MDDCSRNGGSFYQLPEVKLESVFPGFDVDYLIRFQVALCDQRGQRKFQVFPNGPAQRPRTIAKIGSFLDQESLGGIGNRGSDSSHGEPRAAIKKEFFQDCQEMIIFQAIEGDDVVNPVDEFRAEEIFDRSNADSLDLGVRGILVQLLKSSEPEARSRSPRSW